MTNFQSAAPPKIICCLNKKGKILVDWISLQISSLKDCKESVRRPAFLNSYKKRDNKIILRSLNTRLKNED